MGIPPVAAWTLLGVFALLTVPIVSRLVRPVPESAGRDVDKDAGREIDATELLMVLAMAAMVSPLGGPIPAAGWTAVLILTAGYFLIAAVRGRRGSAVHHTIAATAMLYMIIAMPAHTMDHGPWFTMTSSSTRLAVPALAALAAVYFSYDALLVGSRAIRNARVVGIRDATFMRPICRAVMGASMAYLFVSSAV